MKNNGPSFEPCGTPDELVNLRHIRYKYNKKISVSKVREKPVQKPFMKSYYEPKEVADVFKY